VYRPGINVVDEFDNAPNTSLYSTLVEVFHIVEKDGWNSARIGWLLTHRILKTSD
jgi:hypothetical protein